MKSTIGVRVAAPPQRIFDLAKDISRWPALLPHYRRVSARRLRDGTVLATVVAVRPFGPFASFGFPVLWRAQQWAEGSDPNDLRLRFRHIRGFTRGMNVTWHIVPDGGGSRVWIEHDFRRPLPIVGDALPAIVDRLFTRPIAGRTLATFKELAET